MPYLSSLDMNHNLIQVLPDTLGNLDVVKLDLSHNKLNTLPPSIGDIKWLAVLIVSHNMLTQLPEEMGNLVNLEILIATNNKLTKLPQSFENMRELSWLSLSHNNFTLLPFEVGYLPKLHLLKIHHNDLIDSTEFVNPYYLSYEEISERGEALILQELHLPFRELFYLDISHNQLKRLPIWGMTNLRTLNIKNNHLEPLPDFIETPFSLIELDMRGNNIKQLPKYFITWSGCCEIKI